MAASLILKATDYTKVAAVLAGTASAGSYPDASKRKLHAMYDSFIDNDNAWDLASEIAVGLLPKGSRIVGFIVCNVAVGAAVTAVIEVGGVVASGAWTSMNGANQQYLPCLAAIADTELTENTTVTIVTGSATLAAGKRISVTTLYLNED